MEKRKPHFKLPRVKQAAAEQRFRFTGVALRGGADLGLDVDDMLTIIPAPTARDFHKSMTGYADHTQWQDVYRPTTDVGPV